MVQIGAISTEKGAQKGSTTRETASRYRALGALEAKWDNFYL